MDLSHLNKQQLEAATHVEGPLLILAGAGSGKTKALTHRYAFLVDMLGVATDNILCVTFTNKAAGEMKSRIRTLIGDHDTGYICTFHGFCVRELREDIHLMHYPKNFTIIDDQDQNTIFHTVYEDRSIDPRRYPYSLARDVVSAQKELLQYIPLINQTDNEKLSRLYESARKPEETFLKAKIPYVIYSGVEFYGRKEIKDVLSYLKMLLHQDLVMHRSAGWWMTV